MDQSEKIDLHAEPAARPRARSGRMLLWITAGLPALATLLAFGGPWWSPLDLLAHFRVQYAMILGIAVLGAMFIRQWRVALWLMLPVVINLGLILPLFVHPKWFEPHEEFVSASKEEGSALSLMTYSPGRDLKQTYDELLNLLRNSSADIVLIQDVRKELVEEMTYTVAPFRLIHVEYGPDGIGQAIFIRVTIRSALHMREVNGVALDGRESGDQPRQIHARLSWHGRKVALLGFQGVSPLAKTRTLQQDEQFEQLAQWVARQDEPVIVLGNFNSTPWSYRFRRLLQTSGLENSQLGFGIQGTWPATGGPAGQLPLDHCLISPSFITSSRKLGPSLASSHHELNVQVRWAAGAVDPEPSRPAYEDMPPMRPRLAPGRRQGGRRPGRGLSPAASQPAQPAAATQPAASQPAR